MTTTGNQFTAMIRKNARINTRTRDRRDGQSMKLQMVEAIFNSVQYPGYYNETRTALYEAAFGAALSYEKHIAGYRAAGTLICRIQGMSPWEFSAMLGEMIDAGITNVGQGEMFFTRMNHKVAA